jgi:hypothetical protein
MIFYKCLERALASGELVEAYTNEEETSRFECGRVARFDEQLLLLQTVDENGLSDSIVCVETTDVLRLSVKSAYLNKMSKLASPPELPVSSAIEPFTFTGVLAWAKSNGYFVTIGDTFGTSATGRILEVDVDDVLYAVVDEYGRQSDEEVLPLAHVHKLRIDGLLERARQRLAPPQLN